jgi:glycerol-3-phosphate dehydrogenase (NAD(P)+)
MSAPGKTISIIGAGAWGTALASVYARNGGQVLIWGRDNAVINAINTAHENPAYLPGIRLPDALMATANLAETVAPADILLLVTPAQTIKEMAKAIAPYLRKTAPVVLCAKGINRTTAELPAETAGKLLPENPIAALSGPSFAHDVAANLPTAVTLAAKEQKLAIALSAALSGPAFRVYASDDLKGVELGGALKNVIALAVGVCRGMKLGASAEAALIARGFAELNRLAIALGAKPSTLMGLSGLGDLVLTCSSPQSRNFSFGMALGRADTIGNMPGGLKLAEGALTAPIAAELAEREKIEVPVISTVAQLIDGTITAKAALTALLARPLRKEGE